MLSCTFTFPFHSRGHANVLRCGKTAASGWRNGPVIKVTFSSTPPPLQDPFLPHPPLLFVLFVEGAMNVCFKEPRRMPPRENAETRSSLYELSPPSLLLWDWILSHHSWYGHLLGQPVWLWKKLQTTLFPSGEKRGLNRGQLKSLTSSLWLLI